MEKENNHISTREVWELRQALARRQTACPNIEEQWEALNDSLKIDESTSNSDDSQSDHDDSSIRSRIMTIVCWTAGIAALLVVAIGLWQWSGSSSPSAVQPSASPYAFEASDGEQAVTLTADNGKPQTIAADQQIGAAVVKAKELKLATPRGQDYHLTLADGTEVWLNAESELRFPSHFGKGNREVALCGEAYFQVAKDASRPFVVHTEQFTTRVLGTSFNIRAYSRGEASVTLVEGSVAVSPTVAGHEAKSMVLKPGQQCSMVNGQCSVKAVDTYPITQWREGFFYFDNATMLEIMQELARWYNVNVAFDTPQATRIRLHFVAERSSSLSETIRQLNALGEVKVELKDNVVVVR